jgi:hypothetical protein
MAGRIGEVIESSTTRFKAEAVEADSPPAFGSFVRTGSDIITYGLVYNVYASSVDPGRKPIALGLTEEELSREQPQLKQLLKTDFEVAIIGFAEDNLVHTFLPPWPPRIHSFVYACSNEEIIKLTENLEFIRVLTFLPSSLPTEELIAASIRIASQARGGSRDFLVKAGQEIATLLKDEYEKAKGIIRRLSPNA